jgi:hypothetical protein
MVRMSHLSLEKSRVTSAGLAHLAGMAGLTHLQLNGTLVDDLAPIQRLTRLRVLNLAETPLDDAGLAPVRGLAALERLDLRDTRVTDDGLASLIGLMSLRDLNLSNTRITDHGLPHLAGLKSLEHLAAVGTCVSFDGKKMLRKSRPTIRVDH